LWAPNGKELFYIAPGGALMTVAVQTQGAVFAAGKPVRLFEGPYFDGAGLNTVRHYDVTPDGQRFLMLKDTGGEGNGAQIIVVQNWFEELKRLVPTQ
jgi:hypothetical protein